MPAGSATAARRRLPGSSASLRRLDWVLLAALAGVVGYGLWAIDGITQHDAGGSGGDPPGALRGGRRVLLFVAALFIDPDLYRRFCRPIYFGTLGVMGFVLVAGAATRGSRRWIDVGFFTFQPSEFGKVLFALALAGFLADRAKLDRVARRSARGDRLAAVPIVLVFVQPDIGTALVYTAALAAVLFVAGVRWLAPGVLLGAIALVAALAVLWCAAGRRA